MKYSLTHIAAILAVAACSAAQEAPSAPLGETITSTSGYALVPIAEDLEFPWAIAELPDGNLLVTEREGRLRLIRDGQLVEAPIAGLPSDILIAGQGGLLDIILAPDFEQSKQVYLSYSKNLGEANTTAVISATYAAEAGRLEDVTEIFAGQSRKSAAHFGSRLAFLPDGTLIITLGEGYWAKKDAQDPLLLNGKIVRINRSGSLPDDNPFVEGDGHPAVYTFGHRNVQGLVYDEARDMLFAHEHGPRGGDELNILEPGTNYGWPKVTYGIEYSGAKISDLTEAPGIKHPLHHWVPSIAPSGMDIITTNGFEDWHGDLLIGAMNGPAGRKLVRIDLDEAGNVITIEDLLEDIEIGYRDVLSTPDAIYLATNDLDGKICRLEKSDGL